MITLSDVHLHPVCRGVWPTFRSAYDHARLSSRVALVPGCAVAALTAALLMMYAGVAQAATVLERYYAHDAVEDAHGVIAPWHQGQNGQIDLRVRTAAEFLKRYPWVTADESLMAGPHYVFNARVDVAPDGAVAVLPASDQMNGNLGQRFKYISESLPRYYRYTGDPMAFSHMRIAADFLLDYYVTPSDHAWPEFPISVPLAGRPYGPAEPGGYIQLDLSPPFRQPFIHRR